MAIRGFLWVFLLVLTAGCEPVNLITQAQPDPDSVLRTLSVDQVHDAGITGAGVKIAVVDSGIVSNGDLDTTTMSGFDFVGAGGTVSGWNTDPDSHGTQVASLIAADKDGNGITGFAYDADIVSYNYVTSGSPSTTDSNLTDLINRHVVDNIQISNNSWGLTNSFISNDPAFAESFPNAVSAFQTAQTNGTIFVWASGNDGDSVFGPYEDVGVLSGLPLLRTNTSDPASVLSGLEDQWLVVTSVDENGNESAFTTRCAEAADFCVTAIGEEVTVSNNTGGLEVINGTSFAAPQVSATLALVMEAFPTLTPAQVVSRVKTTATYDGLTSWDGCTQFSCTTTRMSEIFGHGLIDPVAATGVIGTLRLSQNGPALSETALSVPRGLSSKARNDLSMQEITVFDSYDGAPFTTTAEQVITGPVAVASLGYDGHAYDRRDGRTLQAFAGREMTLHPVETAHVFWGDKAGFVTTASADTSFTAVLPLTKQLSATGSTSLISETALQQSTGLLWGAQNGTLAHVSLVYGSGTEDILTAYGAQLALTTEQRLDLGLRYPLGTRFEVFGAGSLISREDRAPSFAQWGYEGALFSDALIGVEMHPVTGLSMSGGLYVPETQITGEALITFADGAGTQTLAFETDGAVSAGFFVAGRVENTVAKRPISLTGSLMQSPEDRDSIADGQIMLDIDF